MKPPIGPLRPATDNPGDLFMRRMEKIVKSSTVSSYDSNAMWAPKAPMLILVFAETKNEEGNNIRTGMFDTGAAWMSLALQANRMGLNSRAMGGIDLEAAYEAAGVPKDRFTAICAIAVGYRGTDEDIHPRMVKNNFANDRKELSEIAFKEQFQS